MHRSYGADGIAVRRFWDRSSVVALNWRVRCRPLRGRPRQLEAQMLFHDARRPDLARQARRARASALAASHGTAAWRQPDFRLNERGDVVGGAGAAKRIDLAGPRLASTAR